MGKSISEGLPSPFFLVGPTGIGKSSVAVALARRVGGEIVNGDAFQVYREIPILSAAPSSAERLEVPHHLYGSHSISENYDAHQFHSEAEWIISEIRERDRLPIVVSGSGLYVKALTHGLSPLPPGDAAVRRELQGLSLEQLNRWLQKVDPESLIQLGTSNRRHLARALEITLLSGEPASLIKREWNRDPGKTMGVFLFMERERLYERINARTHSMIGGGVLDEIAGLSGVSRTGEKTIGLRELKAVIAGELNEIEAVERIQQATRRYAKRQMTWFRRESCFRPLLVRPCDTDEDVVEQVIKAG